MEELHGLGSMVAQEKLANIYERLATNKHHS